MNVEVINIVISLMLMAVTAGGTIAYMKTKITSIENDLNSLKEDTANNIEGSYNKLQIFINKMEENLANIRGSIDKVENNLEKEFMQKLESHRTEIEILIKRIEKNHDSLATNLDKFKEFIFSKYDNLRDDLLETNTKVNEVANNCKLITKEYLTKGEASEIYVRRDIFQEKESIFFDRFKEVRNETEKNTSRINKIENNLVEFLTMFKFKTQRI